MAFWPNLISGNILTRKRSFGVKFCSCYWQNFDWNIICQAKYGLGASFQQKKFNLKFLQKSIILHLSVKFWKFQQQFIYEFVNWNMPINRQLFIVFGYVVFEKTASETNHSWTTIIVESSHQCWRVPLISFYGVYGRTTV